MRFTLSWLKEHLDTSATLAQLTDTLTAIGLEVEDVKDPAAELAPFTVAEVVEAVQHPNAERLRVCKVNDGQGVRQVVCGAPNARAGIKVALAREGVTIPGNGMVIKKSAIRGVESSGMLCSAHELGIGEDGGGIIELPASAKVGESIVSVLGLNDAVIEINITPNRADCLGVHGIARDLAAAGMGALKNAPSPLPSPRGGEGSERKARVGEGGASSIRVTLATEACPLFVGCYIKGVKNGPSPAWLQQRLTAIGLRPISALVDVTNFMTFAYGRPLHVFDAKKLKGNITVRMGKAGEKLAALNEKEYALDDAMIAICDEAGAQALGGIIGGTATGCDENTTEVFLESAYFDPVRIAATGRALAIDSDARYRFERGVDPAFVKPGAEIAAAMIVELCGGEASELVIAGAEPKWQRSIAFDLRKVESLGGLKLPEAKIVEILAALGFVQKGKDVTPPSWRADVEGAADLVEEVLRISRYDSIETASLPFVPKGVPPEGAMRRFALRQILASRGMNEACSFAFVPQARAAQFGGGKEELMLANPISADLDAMRPNLLPGLLAAAQRNGARGFHDLALFEAGNVFESVAPEGQKQVIAGLRTGKNAPRNTFKGERDVDAFDAKADLFALLEASGLNAAKLAVDGQVPAWYHPSRSGRIALGKTAIAYFGELHPTVLASFDIEGRAVAFELLLDALPQPKAKGKSRGSLTLSNFQSSQRDFAFVGDAKIAASEIVKAVEGAEKQLVRDVSVFDIYEGKGVEPGKKSVAIAITLQAADRTLSEAEIEAVSQKIIAAAGKLGLVLRT